MRQVHIFLDDIDAVRFASGWQPADFKAEGGVVGQFIEACRNSVLDDADACVVHSFEEEKRTRPEELKKLGINRPPALVIYDTDTQKAIGILKGSKIKANKILSLYGASGSGDGKPDGTGEKKSWFDMSGDGGFGIGLGLGELFGGEEGCPPWMPTFVCRIPVLVVLLFIAFVIWFFFFKK